MHEWIYEEQSDNVITEMYYNDYKITIVIAPHKSIKGDTPLGKEVDLIPLASETEALVAISEDMIAEIYKISNSESHGSFAFGVTIGQLCFEAMMIMSRHNERKENGV